MTKNNTYLLGILMAILLGTYFFYRCCNECGKTLDTPETQSVELQPTPEATSFPFEFSDGDYSYSVHDNFNFNLSSYPIVAPISEKLVEGVSRLTSYLSENKEKVIGITGLYRGDEANPSAYPNLGLARANSVKNYLVSKGIPSSQINTYGIVFDEMIPEGNSLLGPVTYAISRETEDDGKALVALLDKLKAAPLILYFDTGEASINLSPEERQKVADISRYLDKVSAAVCSIVGHTDNTGPRAANVELGLSRAAFAKSYFVQNGIPETRIIISSQGPDVPIASNTTEDGKAKNRRTVVSIN